MTETEATIIDDNKQTGEIERTRSVDDLIVKDELQRLGKIAPDKLKSDGIDEHIELENKKEVEKDNESETESLPEAAQSLDSAHQDNVETVSGKDEYGNTIDKDEKEKLYTRDEVNELIRDRLKRGRYSEEQTTPQYTQQQINQAQEDGFKHDPTNEESWEVQLEKFIDKTIEKREQTRIEREWKAREEQKQAEFEIKFTSQMEKYKDFRDVVANKPVSDAMMRATMAMDNPAAFIYAACKNQPKEIERISKIQDPAHQILEIGRLEEKMKKSRAIPLSPKPATRVMGDVSDTIDARPSIDSLIHSHAKSKLKR